MLNGKPHHTSDNYQQTETAGLLQLSKMPVTNNTMSWYLTNTTKI